MSNAMVAVVAQVRSIQKLVVLRRLHVTSVCQDIDTELVPFNSMFILFD